VLRGAFQRSASRIGRDEAVMHSIMRTGPTFGAAMHGIRAPGIRSAACRPCRGPTAGIGARLFAWFSFPIETTLVAMSRTRGSPPDRIEIGLVDTPAARVP